MMIYNLHNAKGVCTVVRAVLMGNHVLFARQVSLIELIRNVNVHKDIMMIIYLHNVKVVHLSVVLVLQMLLHAQVVQILLEIHLRIVNVERDYGKRELQYAKTDVPNSLELMMMEPKIVLFVILQNVLLVKILLQNVLNALLRRTERPLHQIVTVNMDTLKTN